MKFLHISDLHLGKRLGEFSLIEDQQYILLKLINIIQKEQPDALLIAGDVYDKGIPSVEAVALFDKFLNQLAELKQKVFIISGNHDSPERITCGSKLMEGSGVYFARTYDGTTCKYTLEDDFGRLNIYLLPFVKPAHVKNAFPDQADSIDSYTKALDVAVKKMAIDKNERNILVAHQFVTGSTRCESEEISVGGSDNVDAEVFKDFDYVALGHLHGPQVAGSEFIRYSGSPLKYSFSEVGHNKVVLCINISKKGDIKIDSIPLEPKRDVREIKGFYNDVVLKKNYENTNLQDYMRIILTDEEDIPEGFAKLQNIYPNLVRLEYDNTRTKNNNIIDQELDVEKTSPLDLFSSFYELQNNKEMTDDQRNFTQTLIEEIWGGEK